MTDHDLALPHAIELIPRLQAARDRAGALLLGLDFDGTLAPIVPRPEDAAMPAELRPVIESLVQRADTRIAFISGRGLDDLTGRVAIDGAFYAGNHGLEIEGPGVRRMHEQAAAARDSMAALAGRLRTALADIPHATVEDKGVTLSVHYRRVTDDDSAAQVRRLVRSCTDGTDGLRVTDGKKVVEIRPDVDWHKGRALAFLRSTIEQRFGPAPAVFIGDDRTDEDAFRELGDGDWAIVVGDPPPPDTSARARLRDTDDVAGFLRSLAAR
ncbi:hypothetical protein BH23GEM10_BH23GEM10_06410 [soil metagenome]